MHEILINVIEVFFSTTIDLYREGVEKYILYAILIIRVSKNKGNNKMYLFCFGIVCMLPDSHIFS